MRFVQRLRSLAAAALFCTSGKLPLPFRMLGIDRVEV